MNKVMVTGCYGFIASRLIQILLERGHSVVGFGRASNVRNQTRLHDVIGHPALRIIHGDLQDVNEVSGLLEGIDVVYHLAAKTFVDHSIKDPLAFVGSNIIGTYNLLESARQYRPKVFLNVSTDEVYGAILEGAYKEDSRLNPTNPYAASKAAADMLCLSYANTYDLDIRITRSENVCGPWQHPQKVFPTFVRKILAGEKLPIYGDGQHKRMWIYVDDNIAGLIKVVEEGKKGQIYHVAGSQELTNLDLAKKILARMKASEDLISFIPDHNIRPGHDRRYALDSSKLHLLGWEPGYSLDETINTSVDWYVNHKEWLT